VTVSLRALEPYLAAVRGTVSIWCGSVPSTSAGEPAYAREPDVVHYAASTMKAAVMVAAYRMADEGVLDLDTEVLVHDDFVSATGTSVTYRSTADYDADPEPWERLGKTVPLRWLIRRMIVRSSNLATNLVMERVDGLSIARAWHHAGARRSVVSRGIQDYAAESAGLSNLVTASDLAALLASIQNETIASPESCTQMLGVLLAQEIDVDVVQGLPRGTRVAHKNGWVENIRHSAALILPEDRAPYVLATCVSAEMTEAEGAALVAKVAAASWSDRHLL
jgi:beta-lactamase class A